MDKGFFIVGDSDALISIFHNDANHQRTKELLKKLSIKDAEIIFPAAIIAEAITTTLQKRFRENNPQLAQLLVQHLTSDFITIVPTDEEILQLAASLFNPHGSKSHTFFDAVVLATAKKYKAYGIFSYDRWYKEQGILLVEDLYIK